jgi:hypothetical protein
MPVSGSEAGRSSISAGTLTWPMPSAASSAASKRRSSGRAGIRLVATEIGDEADVPDLIDLDVPFAQGSAFATPRPEAVPLGGRAQQHLRRNLDLADAERGQLRCVEAEVVRDPALAGLVIGLPQASWRGLDAGQRSLLAPLRGRIGRQAVGQHGLAAPPGEVTGHDGGPLQHAAVELGGA